MLTVISPAKRLEAKTASLPDGTMPTAPEFAAEAKQLVKIARGLSVADLRKLMHISEPLAQLNVERFATFGKMEASPAALLFAGDTYTGLEAKTLDPDTMRWAQGHLRILSGLYGLLRPLDLIEPYRLEMGSRLQTPRGENLYAFWGDKLAKHLSELGEEVGAKALINCASVEYFGAVAPKALRLPVITPVFLEDRNGEGKTVSFWAKKARGAMARYISEHHLTDPEAIKDFTSGGYRYDLAASEATSWVFRRAV